MTVKNQALLLKGVNDSVEAIEELINRLVMKQIHARPEHPEEAPRILIRKLTENAGSLDDLEEDAG